MKPTMADLEAMARQAGEILRRAFRAGGNVYHKGMIDLVTDADRQSEEFLIAEIKHRFPDDRIVAEESGGVPGEDCCVWFIDPLDGTVNYAHGLAIFSVSIAYAEGGELRLGTVYDPISDEIFSATKTGGALLNGETIQTTVTDALDQSLLVTGFPYDIRTNPANNLDNYARFALLSQGVRRLGSAALDLCYVAAGRFDGYWELSLESWDLAAGALIAKEAGARVSKVNGRGDILTPPYSVIAANPALHELMLDVLTDRQA